MALQRIKDFDPDYRTHFEDRDIIGYGLYNGNEKVGSVDDLLVDETSGQFRYLVINTGAWIFGKKVLLPIGRASIDNSNQRVSVPGLTKEQVERLPEFTSEGAVDYDYEEQVRGSYRSVGTAQAATPVTPATFDRTSYRHEQEPALYGMNDRDHQNLRLYEERLIANKQRQKTGEVIVGKRVETQEARVQVPLDKERVVVERTTPTDAGRPVAPGEATFAGGEVARVEVYEETPDIRKEAFVREEVNVRKVVDHETVNAEEQIRREELDVDTQGRPNIDNSTQQRR